jgi:hypothetical protein
MIERESEKPFDLGMDEELTKYLERNSLQPQDLLICRNFITQFMPLDDLMAKSCYRDKKRLVIGI